MSGRSRNPYVLLLVPLLMAVVLITLAIPVTCTMAVTQMPSGCDSSVPAGSGTHTMPMGTHTTPAQPQGGGHACTHVTAATQAISPESLKLVATALFLAALFILAAPSMLSSVARIARVVLEPSPPPGLVLIAAQLRV
jgi:hypothetical protein